MTKVQPIKPTYHISLFLKMLKTAHQEGNALRLLNEYKNNNFEVSDRVSSNEPTNELEVTQ